MGTSNPEAQPTAEGGSGGGEAGTNWSDLLYGDKHGVEDMKNELLNNLSILSLHEKHTTEGFMTPVVTQDGDTVFFACGRSIGESKEIANELLTMVEQIKELQDHLDEHRSLIKEASDYLDTNKLTSICSSSILHKKFKEAI